MVYFFLVLSRLFVIVVSSLTLAANVPKVGAVAEMKRYNFLLS